MGLKIKGAPEPGWYLAKTGLYPPVLYTGKNFFSTGEAFEQVKGCVIELRHRTERARLTIVAAMAWHRRELLILRRCERLEESPTHHNGQDISVLVAKAEAYAEQIRVAPSVEVERYNWRADRDEVAV